MTCPIYLPPHRRQNVRLGWGENGRRQETRIYPEHSKVKERWFSRKRVFSNPLFSNRENAKESFQQRPRGKTTSAIIEQVQFESYEMNELRTTEIQRDDVVQTNKASPDQSVISSRKMTRVLKPPEVTSSKSVQLKPNPPQSTTFDFGPPPIRTQRDAPNIMDDTLNTPEQQHHESEREPSLDTRATVDFAFWSEWSNISQQRIGILGLRSKIHEMRSTLREKQNRKSLTEDRLIQRVLQQELAVRSFQPPAFHESILDLVHDCQKARDDYGPLEDQCTGLEDELYRDEFALHRLEEQFYLRWNFVPNLRQDGASYLFRDEASLNMNFEEEHESEEQEQIEMHPMVEKLLSRKGDLDMLNEQLYEFEERLSSLEGGQESRDRYGGSLSAEDQKFQANSKAKRKNILELIDKAQADVEELRENCLSMKLIDEQDEPINSWKKLEPDEDIDSGSEISAYSKYSTIMAESEATYSEGQQISTIYAHPTAAKLSQVEKQSNQVESWMLMSLRCSAINIYLFARLSETKGISLSGDWQQTLLDLWLKDGYSASSTIRPRTSSLVTQAPQQRNEQGSFPSSAIKLSVLKKSPPRSFYPPAADGSDITEIEDVIGLD